MPIDENRAGAKTTTVESQASEVRQRVECRLADLIPRDDKEPQQLHRAMRYSLLGRGKRIRPLVTVMVATHMGGREDHAVDPACAIEMVHTASLILDDLPTMDDATLRRGRPANHVAFGHETALLAALALLNGAYAVMGAATGLSDDLRLKLVMLLSDAVGSNGLITGQMLDLENWPGRDIESLEHTNMLKTAALFVAGAEAGALVAGASPGDVESVRRFARELGLAFQLLDDLLDVSHTEAQTGKNVEQDEDKATLVSSVGPERARVWADQLLESAVETIAPLGSHGEHIARLVQYIVPHGPQTGQTP